MTIISSSSTEKDEKTHPIKSSNKIINPYALDKTPTSEPAIGKTFGMLETSLTYNEHLQIYL